MDSTVEELIIIVLLFLLLVNSISSVYLGIATTAKIVNELQTLEKNLMSYFAY